MGCDVHAAIEFEAHPNSERWQHFAAVELDRWYSMFGRMAGVRGDGPPVAEPRGLPDDIDDYWTSRALESGDHTPSWLTTAEFRQALELTSGASGGDGSCYSATLAAMEVFEAGGKRARLVFNFDN